jgi:hypothetical protein
MSHLFVGVHEQNYIAHVVEHATETWKRDGYKRVVSGGHSHSIATPIIIIISTLVALRF